jgi:hypothetical protein
MRERTFGIADNGSKLNVINPESCTLTILKMVFVDCGSRPLLRRFTLWRSFFMSLKKRERRVPNGARTLTDYAKHYGRLAFEGYNKRRPH